MGKRNEEVDAVGLSVFAVYEKGTVKFMKKQCEAVNPFMGCASRCVLNAGHPLPHRSLTGTIFEDANGPCTERLWLDQPCVLPNGHDGVHLGFDGFSWTGTSEKPKHPKRQYCQSRHLGDEPCILGHGHVGEHFGANGTHWTGPNQDAQSYRSTEAFERMRRNADPIDGDEIDQFCDARHVGNNSPCMRRAGHAEGHLSPNGYTWF